jgi:hypothetical protein
MTARYTIINNPNVGASQLLLPRRVETGDARAILTDRQFHVFGDLVLHAMGGINPRAGGGFVTGVQAAKRVMRLRQQYPTIPLIIEPAAIRTYYATPAAPFLIDMPDDSFFAPSLDAALDLQLLGGSDLAVTPTGQIAAGDAASLKAALRQANALDRIDVLLALPLAAGWLSDPALTKQLIKVIDRSIHPVLVMFIDPTNPIASKKRLLAYSRLFEETTGAAVAYRTDAAGYAAQAVGAITSAIGSYPSVRRLNPVGQQGRASDPEDLSPHMFIGDLLRFVRSTHMRRVWFANAQPFACMCDVCGGAPIDRLHGSAGERVLGHRHNVIEIGQIHNPLIGMSTTQRRAQFRALVSGAVDTYAQLEAHIGAPIQIPVDLTVWGAI